MALPFVLVYYTCRCVWLGTGMASPMLELVLEDGPLNFHILHKFQIWPFYAPLQDFRFSKFCLPSTATRTTVFPCSSYSHTSFSTPSTSSTPFIAIHSRLPINTYMWTSNEYATKHIIWKVTILCKVHVYPTRIYMKEIYWRTDIQTPWSPVGYGVVYNP